MDLLSLVLTLRPATEAALPPRLGRAAHAILLAEFARYAGVGAQTTMGMGQVRQITAGEWRTTSAELSV